MIFYVCTLALLDLVYFWPMADRAMGALCTLSPHVHTCPSCTLNMENDRKWVMGKKLMVALDFGKDGNCQVLREIGKDCPLASVARLTEARESFYVAVLCFVALPPGDKDNST